MTRTEPAITQGTTSGATRRDPWSIAALVFAAFATMIGLWLIGAYVFEAVIARLGEPDQSLLFWYLPLLFIGIFGVLSGVVTGSWGIARRKGLSGRSRRGDAPRA